MDRISSDNVLISPLCHECSKSILSTGSISIPTVGLAVKTAEIGQSSFIHNWFLSYCWEYLTTA